MTGELEQARQIVARRCAEKPLCENNPGRTCRCRGSAREILAISEACATDAKQKELRAIIDFIRPALPVLHTMCKAAGFKLAAAKAAEMIEALNEVKS